MEKSVLSYYQKEIVKKQNSPQVFRKTSNELFGFNGSNIILDKYEVLFQKYVLEKGRGMNSIEAFDEWMLKRLPEQIKNTVTEDTEKNSIRFFDNIRIYKPSTTGVSNGKKYEGVPPGDNIVPMYPSDALMRKESYNVEIHVDVYEKQKGTNETFATRLISAGSTLVKIPILKGSHYCWLRGMTDAEKIAVGECFNDPLGYFIVGGMEKSIVSAEKLNSGQMIVSKIASKSWPSIYMTSLLVKNSIKISLETNQKGSDVINVIFHNILQVPVLFLSLLLWFLFNERYIDEFKISSVEQMVDKCKDILRDEIIPEILSFIDESKHDRVEHRLTSTQVQTLNMIESGSQYVMQTLSSKKKFDPIEVFKLHIDDSRKSGKKQLNFFKNLRDEIRLNVFPLHDDDVFTENEHLNNFDERQAMLSKMTSVYIRHLSGLRPEDDLNSYCTKKIDSSARITEIHFNALLKKSVGKFKINSMLPLEKSFTDELARRFRSGMVNSNRKRESVTEPVQRETPAAIYSQLQRVSADAGENAGESIRAIHPTQYGFICTGETPDGKNCGILKNLTSVGWISVCRNEDDVFAVLGDFLVDKSEVSGNSYVPLLLNGNIVGWISKNDYILMRRRIKTDINLYDVSVSFNTIDNHIDVFSFGSLPTRPLFVVNPETGRLLFDSYEVDDLEDILISDLVRDGVIEFLSVQEIESKYPYVSSRKQKFETIRDGQMYVKIAEYPKDVESLEILHSQNKSLDEQPYTHSELIPHAQFGYAAASIPKANLNKGARITYQCSMFKQALSGHHSMYSHRFDTKAKVHQFPSRALFETSIYEPIGLNVMPTASTPIIAIMVKSMNNEDAIVAKREFLDNNLRYAVYSTHSITIIDEKITVIDTPDDNRSKSKLHALYTSSDVGIPDSLIGFPKIGKYVDEGDAILGKYTSKLNPDTGKFEYKSSHVYIGLGGGGFIVAVETSVGTQTKTIRIKICQQRRQVEGDKVASRYSQKGTFGQIVPEKDLPRIVEGPNNGVTPDLFFNPHSIPSRLTQGKILEILASKAALYTGQRVNASSFGEYENDDYMNEFVKILTENGMEESGLEKMVHPNGKVVEARIFVGACGYQLLKHHVADKAQVRETARYEPKTHQPVGGRTNRGGLRIGEMEKDALISHGTSAVVQDRLLESSDLYRVIVCKKCGNIAKSNFDPRETTCGYCQYSTDFGALKIPYIAHLIIRVLNGAGIHMHFKF